MQDQEVTENKPSMREVLAQPNFRLLWLGETISVLGDQFYLIALPWLVLQLTGDGLAVGTVLAMAGIPRALFMLFGGAFTDRFSPRTIMLFSNLVRMILVGLLTLLTYTGVIQLWMLYGFALAFGFADAFFYPASSAILPQLVEKRHLAAGNSLVQGMAQISIFLGPVLAGLVISAFSRQAIVVNGETVPDLQGIALAFGVDALTFLVSVVTLWLIHVRAATGKSDEDSSGMIAEIRAGIRFVWSDHTLRMLMLFIAGINFLFGAPFIVGVPVLADTRFIEGAVAYGSILSGLGGGMLLGTILAGVLRRPPQSIFGSMVIVLISTLGLGLIAIGLSSSLAFAVIFAGLIGLANGYVNILAFTWMQANTPENMMGRVMSLIMFASVGLNPIAMALAGVLVKVGIIPLFVGCGVALTLFTLAGLFSRELRRMGYKTQFGVN